MGNGQWVMGNGQWVTGRRTSEARTKLQRCKDTESGRQRMGQEWAWARAARTPGEPGACEVGKREGDSCQRRPTREEGGLALGWTLTMALGGMRSRRAVRVWAKEEEGEWHGMWHVWQVGRCGMCNCGCEAASCEGRRDEAAVARRKQG
jgi:hypothetical protein